jgi:hypothetical protein
MSLTGTSRHPAAAQQSGRYRREAVEADLTPVIPGRRAAANPESIITVPWSEIAAPVLPVL